MLGRDFAEIRGVATVRTAVRGKLSRGGDVRFATGPGRRKFEFSIPDSSAGKKGPVIRSVQCVSEDGGFELERRGEDRPFVIKEMGKSPMRLGAFQAMFGRYLDAPWSVIGGQVSSLISLPNFKLIGAREVVEGDRPLLEYEFEAGTVNSLPVNYKVAFDPAIHWAIVRSETRMGVNLKDWEKYEITYASIPPNGKPFTRSVHYRDSNGQEQVCEFDRVESSPTPPSEFTLEFYDLVDPTAGSRGSRFPKVWVAMLAIAIGLLFVGWWFKRLARKAA